MRVKVLVLVCVFVCLATANGYTEQSSNTQGASLGEIARQLKAHKAKEPKPVMVVTNDNITELGDQSAPIAAPQSKDSASPSSEASKPAEVHDAEYFRTHMSALQNQLDTHKRELAVLQQKLGQNSTQYYSNPQDSLMQQYSRSDINKLTADIDAKKQQISDDEKAIEDLRDQLRREGGDPEWLR
jgi:parvulin-like peptidyl-prolyl isomerase